MRKFISTVYLNMDDSYLLRSNIGMENIFFSRAVVVVKWLVILL